MGIRRRARGVRLFFFFQAEDGIRDYKVTGVQTCALPIYERRGGSDTARSQCATQQLPRAGEAGRDGANRTAERGGQLLGGARSEERRVGEEGRSRWSPDH